MGVSLGKCPDNVLRKFVERALRGEDITILGGSQRFSFLDVHDAVKAICRVVATDACGWRNAYNIGMDEQTHIVQLAELIASSVSSRTGRPKVRVLVRKGETEVNAGMVCDLVTSDFGWTPQRRIDDIVQDTIEYASVMRKR